MVQARQRLTGLSAGELARLIRARDVSAAEVVERHVERIEEVNPKLAAVAWPLFDRAREEAAAADVRTKTGGGLPPLHGVPVTIKDQFEVEGAPSTWGLPSRAGGRSERDGPMVRRLRDAGAIVLGITNVPQMLIYHESDNPVYGTARNPFNGARTPGGSSGGEAAVVAAGGSSLGLGSDLGGSLRVPAHFCGVHTLKPTSHRLSTLDNPPFFDSGLEAIVSQPGPIARAVEDLELAMSVLAAPGQFDHAVPPLPWPDPTAVDPSRLRIAMYEEDGYFEPSPSVRRAVHVAADALRAEGAMVEPWQPPRVPEAIRLFYSLLAADGGASFKRALGSNPKTRQIKGLLQLVNTPNALRPAVAAGLDAAGQHGLAFLMRSARRRSADGYWRLVEERNRYQREFIDGLDAGRFDAIICPPHALPALTHGASYYVGSAASYSMLYNLLGFPAGVAGVTRVQAGEESGRPASRDLLEKTAREVERASAGLPLGVQVAARHWREDVVLSVMRAVERRLRDRADYPSGALATSPPA